MLKQVADLVPDTFTQSIEWVPTIHCICYRIEVLIKACMLPDDDEVHTIYDYSDLFHFQTYLPLKDKLLAAGVPLQLYEYDAGHAFTNFKGPNYDKEATDLAFKRMYEFMHKHL